MTKFDREGFLTEIYGHSKENNNEDGTDLIFDVIDRLLIEGRFEEVDKLLHKVEVDKLNTFLMRSFLSITAAAKDKLPSRRQLYKEIYARAIEIRGEEKARRIFKNLE